MLSHAPGEINFYDELGVRPSASPDEIRHAFRALVRLLHPDHQTDPRLKEAAEGQMRKINRIYKTLSDPERRHAYDEFLRDDSGRTTVSLDFNAKKQIALARFGWIAGAAATIALVLWLGSQSVPGPQAGSRSARPDLLSPSLDLNDFDTSQLRMELRRTMAERDAALRELSSARQFILSHNSQGTESAQPSPPQPAGTMTELPAAATPGIGSFGGFWSYRRSRASHEENRQVFPPELIEADIRQDGVEVSGRYHARFRILGRAVSPEVDFEFSGRPSGSTLTCPWRGVGGARGQVTLNLTPDGNLQVDWTASELGTRQSLTSATAMLMKQSD